MVPVPDLLSNNCWKNSGEIVQIAGNVSAVRKNDDRADRNLP
jgi:hypothetical protein